MRGLFKIFFALVISPPILVLALHWFVGLYSSTRIYTDLDTIPHNKMALVLGTSKYVKVKGNTQRNLFYSNRLEAAVELYKKGKVESIIVSGDNSTKYYNEPKKMKEDLMKMGIPETKIILDNYGVRTFDSVLRSKTIFNQGAITIVSQEFHNERAVFIARWKGINAVAYNAADVPNSYGPKVYLREIFARTKMMMDLIGGAEPEYSGN